VKKDRVDKMYSGIKDNVKSGKEIWKRVVEDG